MKRLIPMVVVLMLGVSSAAHAKLYVGASFLSTNSEIDTAIDNFDTDDSSYKIFAGYTFFKFVGIEASYRDLGTQQQTVGTSSIDVDLEAIDIEARGTLPLGKLFSIFAKVGYADISADGSFDFDGVIEAIDDSDGNLMYGVGVELNLGSKFAVRAEWEEYDVDDTLNSFSVGALFKF